MMSTFDREPEKLSPMAQYRLDCEAEGEVPCIDTRHHHWVYSDEDENVGYCDKCGCGDEPVTYVHMMMHAQAREQAAKKDITAA